MHTSHAALPSTLLNTGEATVHCFAEDAQFGEMIFGFIPLRKRKPLLHMTSQQIKADCNRLRWVLKSQSTLLQQFLLVDMPS